MSNKINRKIVLAKRPVEKPQIENFHLKESENPTPKEDQVLCKTIFLSLHPISLRIKLTELIWFSKQS